MIQILLVFLFFAHINIGVYAADINGNGFDDDILNYLFQNNGYNAQVRPVQQVEIKLGISYRQLVSLDEKSSTLTSTLYLTLQWNDYRLGWNESDFDGVSEILVSASKVNSIKPS